MAESDDNYTVKFISDVLSQPVLNEEPTHGFASRKLKDQSILNNMIKSKRITSDTLLNQTAKMKPIKNNSSKVDKIIAEFLDKVKKRGIYTEKITATPKQNVININNNPTLCTNKCLKVNEPSWKYLQNSTSSSNETTRTNIFIPDIEDYGFFPENDTFHFEENHSELNPRQSLFLKKPHFVDLKSKKQTKVLLDHDVYWKDILSQNGRPSPKLNKYSNFQNNLESEKNIPLPSSQNFEKKFFNFPCDSISPIEFCGPQTSQMKFNSLNTPNAFSTPLPRRFTSQRKESLVIESGSCVQSVSTQTECNHCCVMCSSPSYKKNHKNQREYLFEE